MNCEEIKDIISNLPEELVGDWINKNSSYEKELCARLEWSIDKNRYFDARMNNHRIEIKKGNNIWLDLVRYSEILLDKSRQGTLTTFFIPSKDKRRITDIYFVDTKVIIKELSLNQEIANSLIEIKKVVPRQLNAQAKLTQIDIKQISFYHHCFNNE